MLKCDCKNGCFYYKKITRDSNDDNIINYHHVNKCNRLKSECSAKKHICEFIDKSFINKQALIELEKPKYIMKEIGINNNINIYVELNKLLNLYYYLSELLIGKLNFYLTGLKFATHDPTTETFNELIYRLKNRQYSKKNKLYLYNNIDVDDLRCAGEHKNNNIKRLCGDHFAWTKDPFINSILGRKSNQNNKKRNIKKTLTKKIIHKTTLNLSILDIKDDDKDTENRNNIKDKINKSMVKSDNAQEDSEEEEEEVGADIENNNFDDDDNEISGDDDDDYDDFSD